MKKLIFLLGIVVFSVAGIAPVSAQDIRSTWQTKKVLVVNTNGYGGGELETTKRQFVIGPSEWYVKYERQVTGGNYTPIYEETWKLPALPDCYRSGGRAACQPGGALVNNYLWGLATSFSGFPNDPQNWTFQEQDPLTTSLFTNISNKARGSAVLGGKNSDNSHNVVATGTYGWSHARYFNGDRGGFVWSGVMIPLRWDVTGVNYEE
jgi:hypothetical protein